MGNDLRAHCFRHALPPQDEFLPHRLGKNQLKGLAIVTALPPRTRPVAVSVYNLKAEVSEPLRRFGGLEGLNDHLILRVIVRARAAAELEPGHMRILHQRPAEARAAPLRIISAGKLQPVTSHLPAPMATWKSRTPSPNRPLTRKTASFHPHDPPPIPARHPTGFPCPGVRLTQNLPSIRNAPIPKVI